MEQHTVPPAGRMLLHVVCMVPACTQSTACTQKHCMQAPHAHPSPPTQPGQHRGRKNAALGYVITYSLSCCTKHFPNYWVLMVGRILGGIATSLLYSAFESWLVAEHFKRGYSGGLCARVGATAGGGHGGAVRVALVACAAHRQQLHSSLTIHHPGTGAPPTDPPPQSKPWVRRSPGPCFWATG